MASVSIEAGAETTRSFLQTTYYDIVVATIYTTY